MTRITTDKLGGPIDSRPSEGTSDPMAPGRPGATVHREKDALFQAGGNVSFQVLDPGRLVPRSERTYRDTRSRTSFRVGKATKEKLRERLISDGYGLKAKSRWMVDSIHEFLSADTWTNDEGIGTPMAWARIVVDTELIREPLVQDYIALDESDRILLWAASIEAALYGSNQEPPVHLEISISSVIRAAIMWKLGQRGGE